MGSPLRASSAIQPIPASAQRASRGGPSAYWSLVTRVTVRHDFQYQRGGYAHGYGPGYGVGAGVAAVAAGALIGGAIASQNQGYYPAATYPVYSDPGYGYSDAAPVVYNNGDSVAYCEQTYRSYDPGSGTYLGYDGFRHLCP